MLYYGGQYCYSYFTAATSGLSLHQNDCGLEHCLVLVCFFTKRAWIVSLHTQSLSVKKKKIL